MNRRRLWIAGVCWLAVLAAAAKMLISYGGQQHWKREAIRIQSEIDALPPLPPPPVNPVPTEEVIPREAAPAIDGERLLAELMDELAVLQPTYSLFLALGPKHPKLRESFDRLARLSGDECAALVATDPYFTFYRSESDGASDSREILRVFILRTVCRQLAQADPVRALQLTESATPEDWTRAPTMQRILDECLKPWTEQDPAAAFRWISRRAAHIPSGAIRVSHVLRQAAQMDFHAAWRLATAEQTEKGILIPALIGAARTRDDLDFLMSELESAPKAPGSWSTPEGTHVDKNASLYNLACSDGVARLLYSQGFEAAKAFLDRWAPAPGLRQIAVPPMTQHIIHGTGPEARAQADWLLSQLPEDTRAREAASLAGSWADVNFAETAAWLQAMPTGPSRDAGLDALCRKLAPIDPLSAEQWAGLMQGGPQREKTLARVKLLAPL